MNAAVQCAHLQPQAPDTSVVGLSRWHFPKLQRGTLDLPKILLSRGRCCNCKGWGGLRGLEGNIPVLLQRSGSITHARAPRGCKASTAPCKNRELYSARSEHRFD